MKYDPTSRISVGKKESRVEFPIPRRSREQQGFFWAASEALSLQQALMVPFEFGGNRGCDSPWSVAKRHWNFLLLQNFAIAKQTSNASLSRLKRRVLAVFNLHCLKRPVMTDQAGAGWHYVAKLHWGPRRLRGFCFGRGSDGRDVAVGQSRLASDGHQRM